ncbi:hypothetical protein CHH57_02005 [Niallia circulans]|uniref:Uncharacterized protein n=1 Tax=Niallia circulans TaxID=1397 RepID=A0AA91TW68_NIACI|nr:hypothetical protein [Niallia circulans]PAD84971.1 hypothetical protein CHH57_02005 [Niallia circulans]
MSDEKKIANYDYAVYHLIEFMKCEILELDDNWLTSPLSAFIRGKLNAYRDSLYFLTLDEKWEKPLEVLAEILIEED